MAEEALELKRRVRNLKPIRVDGNVAYITLTRGLEAIIDAADVGLISDKNWGALVTNSGHAYAMRSETRDKITRCILLHRFLMSAPKGLEVDHINGDGLDNRRSNLRLATHRENMANQVVARSNRLGLKGVVLPRGKKMYQARIQFGENRVMLGHFVTPEEAAAAYQGAARIVHGRFAK